jgi:hypothetical protein
MVLQRRHANPCKQYFGLTWWYGNAAAVPLLQQFDNYYARVTLKNGVNTNVRTASRAIGSVMVSVALVKRSSAELFLSSEIHAFIAQHLKVRRGLYGRAHALDRGFRA